MLRKISFDLTLAILKPHVVKSPFVVQKIRGIIIENNFKVVRTRRMIIPSEIAALFYIEHKEKFFYNRLLTFMCSGPCDIHILTGVNVIKRWRELMGPTKTFQAQYIAPRSIRGMFGLSDTRNATHGSDSPESVEKEVAIFFKDFNIQQWYEKEEIQYSLGKVQLDPVAFVHTVDGNTTRPV